VTVDNEEVDDDIIVGVDIDLSNGLEIAGDNKLALKVDTNYFKFEPSGALSLDLADNFVLTIKNNDDNIRLHGDIAIETQNGSSPVSLAITSNTTNNSFTFSAALAIGDGLAIENGKVQVEC
jgi:hypothetical protein